jgi:hypothetical protein
MGAVSMREDSSERFVGQVLDRRSPIVEFRVAQRVKDDAPAPIAPSADASQPDLDAHRDPAESAIRVSLRPMRLPVLSVQRRTRIDLVAIAPVKATWRVARRVARLTLAVATGLALLTLVALGARAAMPGPTLFAAYLAERATTKDLRAELRVDGSNGKVDSVVPSPEALDPAQSVNAANAASPTVARAHGKAGGASHASHPASPHAHHATGADHARPTPAHKHGRTARH